MKRVVTTITFLPGQAAQHEAWKITCAYRVAFDTPPQAKNEKTRKSKQNNTWERKRRWSVLGKLLRGG